MKKFQFSLATLKKYNDQILETEKNTLGALRKELSDLEKQQLEVQRELEATQQAKTEKCIKGTTPLELTIIQRYISELQLQVHTLADLIGKKRLDVENQLQRVVVANQEVSKLDKLEQRQLEEYREKEKKEEEAFIEEFVSNTSQPEK